MASPVVTAQGAATMAVGRRQADPIRTKVWAKTKMCRFFPLGSCCQGAECQFAHDESELQPMPDLSCTKLCRTLVQTGKCTDRACKYAHTSEELRCAAPEVRRSRGPCRFWLRGSCVLGERCTHAHEHVPSSKSAISSKQQRASVASQSNSQTQTQHQSQQQSNTSAGRRGCESEAVVQTTGMIAVPCPMGMAIAGVSNLGPVGFAVDCGNNNNAHPQIWQQNGMMSGAFVQQGQQGPTAMMWQPQQQQQQQCQLEQDGAYNGQQERPQVCLARSCVCGNVFQEDCRFCRMCGMKRAQLADAQHCTKCNAPFTADALFCRHCGERRASVPSVGKARAESVAGSSTDEGRESAATDSGHEECQPHSNPSDGYDTGSDWE